mmetsp:Transcript_30466/g.52161  ORF Transcript_30466/g.52161 Transcript_30466/m.52161 type:complete len:203 (-) Transcript_30466:661-1269(-)
MRMCLIYKSLHRFLMTADTLTPISLQETLPSVEERITQTELNWIQQHMSQLPHQSMIHSLPTKTLLLNLPPPLSLTLPHLPLMLLLHLLRPRRKNNLLIRVQLTFQVILLLTRESHPRPLISRPPIRNFHPVPIPSQPFKGCIRSPRSSGTIFNQSIFIFTSGILRQLFVMHSFLLRHGIPHLRYFAHRINLIVMSIGIVIP